jgi:LPS sulfotransferase NodH
MVKFIVLTTQRSGATFFIKCLSSHPQIACRHETIFSQNCRFKYLSFDRPGSFYHQYRTSSKSRQFAHWFRRNQLIHACLDDYLHAQPHDVQALGFKVSYNHIEKYPDIVTWIEEHDTRVIHLVRNNILKTVLSLETSKLRKLHHSTEKVKPVQVHLKPWKLLRNLKRRARIIEKYRAAFTNNPRLELSYESLVANQDAEMRRVLQFLDVDTFMSLDTDLVKINPDSLEDIIENYDQVAQALKGTAFEKYLVT